MIDQKPHKISLSSPSPPPGSPDDERSKLAKRYPELGDDYIPYVLSNKRFPWLTDRKALKAQKDLRSENTDLTDQKIQQTQEALKQTISDLDIERELYNAGRTIGLGGLDKLGAYIKKHPKLSGVTGIVTSLLVTLGLGGSIMLGPLQLNHFANLLTEVSFGPSESQTDIRVRKLFAYSKFIVTVKGFEQTRLGTIGQFRANQIDAILAKSGITSNFDANGKFNGYSVDTSKLPENIQNEINNDPKSKEKILARHFRVPLDTVVPDGKGMTITAKGMRQSRHLNSMAMKISPDFHHNISALDKRVLNKRANVSLNPITRLKNKALEKFADKYIDLRDERAKRISGKDINVPDATPKQAETDPEASPEDQDETDTYNKKQKESADVLKSIKAKMGIPGGAAVGVILGAICLARDISNSLADEQKMQKYTTAANVAAEGISWSSKMLAGDFDIEAMFIYISTFYSKDRGDAFNSSLFKKEKTTSFTKTGGTEDLRTLDKPENQEYSPDLDSNWSKIDDIFKSLGPGNEAIGVACKLMDTPGTWLSWVGDKMTGGLTSAVESELTSRLMAALQGEVDITNIIGEVLGELALIGGRFLNNSSESASGAQETTQETQNNITGYFKDYKYTNDNRSTFAKLFNVLDINSVASQALIGTYGQSTLESVASLPSNTILSFSNFFGVVKAEEDYATSEEDYYGLPTVGVDPIFSDPPEGTTFETEAGQPVEFENPYILITEAQQRLKDNPEVKEYLEKCNKIKISSDMYAETQGANEGAAANYLAEDGGCEDPNTSNTYTVNNIPPYRSVAQKPSIKKSLAKIFSPKAVAEEDPAPTPRVIKLTTKQATTMQTIMALKYTREGIAYAALEANDDDAMKMMYGGESPSTPSTAASSGGNISKDGWVWPLAGAGPADVSNGWGEPVAIRNNQPHTAIDIPGPKGAEGAPVLAAHDGEVIKSYYSSGCGWFYTIKATGTPYWMTYEHLSSEGTKPAGTVVKAGEEIGKVGEYCGSGFHLHFGVEKTEEMSFYGTSLDKSIDPLDVLP